VPHTLLYITLTCIVVDTLQRGKLIQCLLAYYATKKSLSPVILNELYVILSAAKDLKLPLAQHDTRAILRCAQDDM